MGNIQPENYRFLQEHVRRQSGIVIDDDKHYLVEARLMPLVFDHGLRNLDELCVRCDSCPTSRCSVKLLKR